MVSEKELIERVRRRMPSAGRGLSIGIGDDAAVLRPAAGAELVVTTDAFLENVHFLRKGGPAEAAGYKALARATSDLAAMGAQGRCFFLTMGLPDACTGAWLDRFLGGMARAARRFGLVLAGGDTTRFPQVVASLTVVGEVRQGKAILRSGAKPGDLLCVSGRLGEAGLGLWLAQKNLHKRRRYANLLKKHFYPEPRLGLGEWLGSNAMATSMIDTSDGLSTDLGHICKASGVGAIVWAPKIPVVKIPPELRKRGLDPLQMALHGGEDYELLFTVPKQFSGRVPRKIAGVPVTAIGEMTPDKKIVLASTEGSRTMLPAKGWDPFR